MAGRGAGFRLKRVYEPPAPEDGKRVLVERLWPRGLSREDAHLDLWLRDIAPSADLRKWYGHDPSRFEEFQRRYLAELAEEPARTSLSQLQALGDEGTVTLLFAARDVEHSNAAVLRARLERRS